MRRLIILLFVISAFVGEVFSENNALRTLKVISLPEGKVRVDFKFDNLFKQLPTSFITQHPPRLILDFVASEIKLPLEQKTKEVRLGSLNTYNIVALGDRVRVILDLQHTVSYSGRASGTIYSLLLNGQQNTNPLTPEIISQTKLKKQAYTGKRISLNFQRISIRTVLQLLADFTGINIVVSDNIQGDITLRLNDIPWDQALDIILTTQGLGKRQAGNIMLIDTKINLDKIEEAKLKSRRITERLKPIRSDLIQINYAKASDLAALIKDKQSSLLSERGTINIDARTNTIWIQDTAIKVAEVKKLVKKLDIPVRQVLIEARIVEVSKGFSQDIGIRWGIARPPPLNVIEGGSNSFQQETKQTHEALTNRLNLDLVALPANLTTPATIGLALAKINDNILLDLELSALESEGRAELISSPRLITINQQSAVIESGQEIPYQEATSSGATAVAFKKAVLSLKVRPQITADSKILMDLQINQDTTSPKTFNGVPAILTKEIQTNVLVNNGQTIVLGGIYTQDKTKSINRIPFFGQLPVLGTLFRNTQIGVKNDELLIFITPKIITNSVSMTHIGSRKEEVYK